VIFPVVNIKIIKEKKFHGQKKAVISKFYFIPLN